MARAADIRAEGVIVALLPKGRCRVALVNGHRLVAWRKRSQSGARLEIGMKVYLEISPCDVAQGYLVEQKTNLRQ